MIVAFYIPWQVFVPKRLICPKCIVPEKKVHSFNSSQVDDAPWNESKQEMLLNNILCMHAFVGLYQVRLLHALIVQCQHDSAETPE